MSAVVLDCWRSDQIPSLNTQIVLQLLYLPLVTITDVICRILAELVSQEEKYLLKTEKNGKQNKTNMMLRRDTYWHQRKQKRKSKQTKHEQ